MPITKTFQNLSTPGPGGDITDAQWDWGDSSSIESNMAPTVDHDYPDVTDDYIVSLTVTSPDGEDTVSHLVSVVSSGGGGGSSYVPYLASSAFNQKIPASPPIHPDSSLMISAANHWLLGGTDKDQYKEWLGPGPRTTYYKGDTSALPTITLYANGNGWVGAGPYTMPMPSWAASVIGPKSQTGDSNVNIVDSITGDVWELWHCTPPGYTPRDSGFPSNRWNATAYRHWSGAILNTKGYGKPSASFHPGTSGSLIQLTCGLLVPEDFADCWSGSDPGTVIPHALRIDSFCGAIDPSKGGHHPRFVLPAYSGDGKQLYGIPAGGRVQLDPSINISAVASINAKPEPWRSALKKICRTLQVYGGIQVDSYAGPGVGSIDYARPESVAKGGDDYPVGYKFPWDAAGYPWGKNGIPYDLMDNFRVINWSSWTGA